MKKTIIASIAVALCSLSVKAQTIAAARAATVGSNVTIRGIVLNGSELGSIRYVQDPTGGISIYGSNLTSVHRGDSIIANGTLTSYNNLFEMTPVTFTVLATNKPLPTPVVITPSAMTEIYEGQLATINTGTFVLGGGTFAGNTNYNFTSSSQTAQIRITTTTTLVGTVIPNTSVNLTGIVSQFCSSPASGCTSGYQLLLRDGNDIVNNVSIFITSQPVIANIATTSFDLVWGTNIAGSNSYIKYSKDQNLASGTTTIAANSALTHTASLTGLTPATVYYAKVYSINGTDTATSPIKAFCTKSNSSGTIKTYFTRTVDNTVSMGTNAICLSGLIDDTLIAYINRAKSELEIAIYNWDNTTGITAAVNAAGARGVKVRIVYDGSTSNSGMTAIASTNIKWVASPQGSSYTIMHNKFVIIDANTSNPNDAILWTGSTNWTSQQLSTDANNVIIFQDQSMARGYKVEFDEMWGDTSVTSSANGSVSRFGQFKKDNTPHEYIVGGKRIEQYFSPSDNTNSKILNTIGTANTDMYTSNMLITRTDLAQKISSQTTSNTLNTKVLLDDSTTYGTQYFYMQSGVGASNIAVDCHTWILHNKYLVVDQSNASSDPLVLTGSHNWSTAGDTKNDENTVVVHDGTVANLYYQEFNARWVERLCDGAVAGVHEYNAASFSLAVYPNPTNGDFKVSIDATKADKYNMDIVDIAGRNVYNKSVDVNNGANTINVNDLKLQSGVYFITLRNQAENITRKLVIQ